MQILRLNKGFDSSSLKVPPSVEPKPGRLSTTQSRLCLNCRQFFEKPPRVWTGNGIQFRDLVSSDELDDGDDAKQAALACLHIESLGNVFNNSRNRQCHFCTIIHSKLKDHDKYGEAIRLLEREQEGGIPISHRVRIAVNETFRNGYSLYVEVGQPSAKSIFWVYLCILSDIKTNLDFPDRSLSPSTASEGSFQSGESWLNECLDNHVDCKPLANYPDLLPARLLDVDSSGHAGTVLLHTTNPLYSPYRYLALSHCWGTSWRLLLTQDSTAEFEAGISLERLAPTFRDAIYITRRLGLKYIWIDSLCILQDSLQDWTIEAAKMAGIYGNAVCCIAASASSDSQGGCFRDRNPLEVQPIRFEQFPFSLNWETDTSKPLLITKDDIRKAWSWCKGPLDERGWILQEQLLSPRTLHYSRDQIFWECRTLTASEVWPNGIPEDILEPMTEGKSKTVFDRTRFFSQEQSSGYSADDHEIIYRRWENIVGWYTTRSLTKTVDKLPALAGIANVMMTLAQDIYLAGLWKKDLLRGLAWRTLPRPHWKRRSDEYCAPSWSWASTDGRILYSGVNKISRDMESTIYNAEVDSLDNTPTGRVKDGKLDICGLLRRTAWTEDYEKPSRMRLVDEASEGWLDKEVTMFPDSDPSYLTGVIYLLHLYRSHSLHLYGSPLGRKMIHGLVLTQPSVTIGISPSRILQCSKLWILKDRERGLGPFHRRLGASADYNRIRSDNLSS